MITRKTFWSIAVAVVFTGLVAGGAIGVVAGRVEGEPYVRPVWAEVFETPEQMAAAVDLVVVGRPVTVEPGRVAVSENGEDSLPFQLVEFEVLRPVKGASGGETLFVERVAESGGDTPSIFADLDGGPFEIGGRYLLFLKRQPDSQYFYQVNHQGRYRVSHGRLLTAAPSDPVTSALAGKTLDQALVLLNPGNTPGG